MSLSVSPIDLSMARAGARDGPSVMTALRLFSFEAIFESLKREVVYHKLYLIASGFFVSLVVSSPYKPKSFVFLTCKLRFHKV